MAETINMPKLGFDMAEGVLVRWVKNIGETINKGDVLAEIETDKAIVEAGDVVPVNAPIAVVGAEGEKVDAPATTTPAKEEPKKETAPAVQTQEQPVSTQQATASADSGPVKASPLAKKISRDKNVDLANIQGTGPGGRVVRKDVEAALSSGQPTSASRPVVQPTYQINVTQEDKTVSTTKLRQAIGRRLVESKQTVPHFYVTGEYNVGPLMDMRKQANAALPDGEKLSVNDFILKAVALTLRQFPNLNATIKGNEIIQFGHVNVGVAVTVPGGLMTVVIKDTDQKTLRQISAEVKAMAGRARDGKVKPEDVDGSTFSTSNLGMYGVEEFIAIINPPEAAILAIAGAKEVPVIENGEIKPGWRMKATISVDHRVSDGAEAAEFMQALGKYLENPVAMLV
jgi:pyruvate dehydrogenase E2 component (dihydrolipoamide acetyltransferase)